MAHASPSSRCEMGRHGTASLAAGVSGAMNFFTVSDGSNHHALTKEPHGWITDAGALAEPQVSVDLGRSWSMGAGPLLLCEGHRAHWLYSRERTVDVRPREIDSPTCVAAHLSPTSVQWRKARLCNCAK